MKYKRWSPLKFVSFLVSPQLWDLHKTYMIYIVSHLFVAVWWSTQKMLGGGGFTKESNHNSWMLHNSIQRLEKIAPNFRISNLTKKGYKLNRVMLINTTFNNVTEILLKVALNTITLSPTYKLHFNSIGYINSNAWEKLWFSKVIRMNIFWWNQWI